MDQTARDTRNEELVINDKLDHGVELFLATFQHGIELLCLRNCAGESVENKSM